MVWSGARACVLAFGLALGWTLLAASPGAAAPTKLNERVPIPEFAFSDPCTGEAFVGSGTLHLVMRSATGPSGIQRIDVHVNSRVRGTGVLTGTRYTFLENDSDHVTIAGAPFPFTVHAVTSVRIVGQGPASDFRLHIVIRLVFDANGQPTVDDVKTRMECGGSASS